MEKKTFSHLSKEERLEFAILRRKKYSLRDIASVLGRSHSTLSRELTQRSVKSGYDPHKAQHKAYVKRKYSKYQGMKIRERPKLEEYVKEKMALDWTPQEISGRIKEMDTGLPYVSPLGIYKYLYSPFGQSSCKHLKSKRYNPKKWRGNAKPTKEIIPNRVSILERPEIVEKRERIGDVEIDRIESNKYSQAGLVVVHDRTARYAIAVKTTTKKVRETTMAINKALDTMAMVLTLTYDNDLTFREHELVNQQQNSQSYFCQPYHSWEKGGIEYQNRLIREYVPKGTDINNYTQEEIDYFLDKLNHRPRTCLNYKTPYEVMLAKGGLKSHTTDNNLNQILQTKKHPSGAIEG